MVLTARQARAFRRASQRRSQNRGGLGLSELFLAPPIEAALILAVRDFRLKRYLLGLTLTRRQIAGGQSPEVGRAN